MKENEVLKHYRLSCMKLQKENYQLREKLELLQIVSLSPKETEDCAEFRGLIRTSPDGREESKGSEESDEKSLSNNCDTRLLILSKTYSNLILLKVSYTY